MSGFATRAGAKRFQALGRLKAGAMNATETAYAKHLEARRVAGELAWVKFEGIKLRLADNTFYTADFAVMLADGSMELHEVKGARAIFQDDAKVKIKVAAEIYPFQFYACFPRKVRDGGGFDVEPV